MNTAGDIKLSRVDRLRQEDSLHLVWSGTGSLTFDSAQGEDFSRETNADMMLVLTMKVDASAPNGAALRVNCGASCAGSLPLDADLHALPAGQWQRLGIPLKCLARAGADMNRRLMHIELTAMAGTDLSINRIALGVDVDRSASCGN
jgi:beta-glucosidase